MSYRSLLESSRLWIMTSRQLAGYREHHEIAALAIEGGAEAVVMREEGFEEEEFIEEALKVQEVCDRENVPFLVCDQLNAAFIGGLAGVCLLKEKARTAEARRLLGEDTVIAVRADTAAEAEAAMSAGADYLIACPAKAKEISGKSGWPVIATGGVSKENAMEAFETGATKIMVCHAAMDKKEVSGACQLISDAIRQRKY